MRKMMRRGPVGIGDMTSHAMPSFAVIFVVGLRSKVNAIVILLLIASLPIATQASQDPSTTFEVEHCHAAAQTSDWPGVTVYCKAAAEAWVVAAQENSGDLRTIDLTNAAFDLILTGIGNERTQTDDEATQNFAAASALFDQAAQSTTNQTLLEAIERGRKQLAQAESH